MENKRTTSENIIVSVNEAEEAIKTILRFIGENPERAGLIDTPRRIVKMYGEIFRGYDKNQAPKVTVFDNSRDGIHAEGMIIDSGNFYSMCEHHMMPFFGRYYFAYIPNSKGRILGLSKIARVVDHFAAKMQIQERLVEEIVRYIEKALGFGKAPLGVALIMEGEHLCKSMRGIKKQGMMSSSFYTGVFKDAKSPERAELLTHIARMRNV